MRLFFRGIFYPVNFVSIHAKSDMIKSMNCHEHDDVSLVDYGIIDDKMVDIFTKRVNMDNTVQDEDIVHLLKMSDYFLCEELFQECVTRLIDIRNRMNDEEFQTFLGIKTLSPHVRIDNLWLF